MSSRSRLSKLGLQLGPSPLSRRERAFYAVRHALGMAALYVCAALALVIGAALLVWAAVGG